MRKIIIQEFDDLSGELVKEDEFEMKNHILILEDVRTKTTRYYSHATGTFIFLASALLTSNTLKEIEKHKITEEKEYTEEKKNETEL